ncbi:MAG: hypothetical protein HYY16_00750 [Planctomycetes bacterium]|nr:hypothetical protein [Planctomycetota bacterium]
MKVLLLLAILAQETDGKPDSRLTSSVRVQVDAVWAYPRGDMFFPLRIEMQNLGPAREVECVLEDAGGSGTAWNVRRRFQLGERQKVRFSFLVPATRTYQQLAIRVEGEDDPVYTGSYNARFHPATHLVVDGRRDVAGAFGEIGGSGLPACAVLTPERLSDQWQAYAGVAGVWVRGSDWKAIPVPDQQALLRAVKAGQDLVIYDCAESPLPGIEPILGWGRVIVMKQDVRHQNVATILGRDSPAMSAQVLGSRQGIPGVGRVSFSTFFWIVLVFALIIGPVNLIVVSRLGNRLLFFLTTPAVALVAVLILFGYSIVRDGFSIRASIHSVTRLDAEEHEAVTVASMGVYSGMASGTWRLSPESLWFTEVTQEDERDHYWRRRRRDSTLTRAISLDWTRGQELSGGWAPARRLTQLKTVHVGPFRGRLAVEVSGDATLRVHNALGASIQKGCLNWQGRWFTVPEIADNAAGEARPCFPQSMELKAGEFQVRVDRNPALELGDRVLAEIGSVHLITGKALEYK